VAEVYDRQKAEFAGSHGTVKGYVIRARATFAYPVKAVLDASHDHVHLSERDSDVKREEVTRTDCTQEICLINVHVLVGSFFPVGQVTYELETQIRNEGDGGFIIEWSKSTGTRFIKHLHGELRLTPVGETGEATKVDYLLEVAAPQLSLDKLAAKAIAYLERLETIIEERHQGHPSLWG